jgi:hypothetical protein
VRLGHGQLDAATHRLDLIGYERFRQFPERFHSLDVPGGREPAGRIIFDHTAAHVDAAVGCAQDETAADLASTSMLCPKKYWRVNSARISASQTFSGVLAM